MSPWLAGVIALLAVAMPIAIWLAGRGNAVDRLVGLELGSVIGTLALLGFAQAVAQPSYLIVPTVAVVLSFAGTLVFTRLLAPRS
jgi:multisubunit Na+/H+ antiporter MnhF subunit